MAASLVSPSGCPILRDTQAIQGLSHSLSKTIRKLRRDLDACPNCPAYDECPALREFNCLIQTAILEVASEWDSVQSLGLRYRLDSETLESETLESETLESDTLESETLESETLESETLESEIRRFRIPRFRIAKPELGS